MPDAEHDLIRASMTLGEQRAQRLVERDTVAAAAASSGTLIVEGDSWFDYPAFEDIVEALEDEHGYQVRSAARFGETAESMAYDTKQLDRVRRLFKDLRDSGAAPPKGVLLSCGGNDIVGALAVILNHRVSGLSALNEDVVHGLLDVRLKAAIASLVRSLLVFCDEYFPAQPFPLLLHGYGHAVPDGRGFPLGFGFVGPWLKPAFAARGRVDAEPQSQAELSENAGIVATLIDRFNDGVLAPLAAQPDLASRVKHVDLRSIFVNQVTGNAHHASWRDEMHATKQAFSLAASKFKAALS